MCEKSQSANFWGLFWCDFPYFRGILILFISGGVWGGWMFSVILRWVFWCQSTQIWWTEVLHLSCQHAPKKGNGGISSGYPYRYFFHDFRAVPPWKPRPTWPNWNAKAPGTWDALSKKLMVHLKAHRIGKTCFFLSDKIESGLKVWSFFAPATIINTNQSKQYTGKQKI